MEFAARFTREEFDAMVKELLFDDPISFDMLCRIADKTLRSTVVRWCNSEDCLRGRGYEDDVMQEIYLRLIKTTVDYFLLREGIEGPYNNDLVGFQKWMFRIAEHVKCDFARRVRKRDFKTKGIDEVSDVCVSEEIEDDAAQRVDTLKRVFSIVLSVDAGIYKVLTWLAQFLFIMDKNVTKIQSNELIIEIFENKTLYEMYNVISIASKKIPWITISEQQDKKIMNALRKKRSEGVLYGETRYKDFFMKQNGKVSGKKSISDWMNRMNETIRKKMKEETGDS